MTALSANAEVQQKGADLILEYPVEAAANIYKGAMCIINADGFVQPAAALASNEGLAGVAVEASDNSSGSNGDTVVRLYTRGVFRVAKASAAQTDVGTEIYAEDDATVGAEAANLAKAGQIVQVDGTTHAWVDIAEGVVHPEIGS